MPADAELARRDGVEIVRAGSWQLLSGDWEPNRKDILAAVDASRCPAVRRPKIKLGHLDPRFNQPDEAQFDGTPALGWFDNLRAGDGGHTLLGDQVALPWLSKVQAAAWPDRSVEGKYNTRCALGHLHPFVITAVSLLGETPPGIPTLKSIKSIDDLPAALGVMAAGDETVGGEVVQGTIRAAAEVHTGAMIALIPTAEDAERLAVEGGEPAEQLHVTLAYLGDAADLGARGKQDVIDYVSTVVNGLPHLEAEAFALSVFNPPGVTTGDGKDRDACIVLGLSGDVLDAVHDLIGETLRLIDAPLPAQHRPWVAHTTLIYTDDLTRLAGLTDRIGPVRFDRIRLAFAEEFIDIPLMEWPGEDVAASGNSIHDRIAAARQRLTNLEGVQAGAGNGAALMSLAQKIRDAWNASGAPFTQWVQEVRANAAVVVDDADRTHRLIPVSFDGDRVLFGTPQPYDPESDRPVVFASRAESRPEASDAPPPGTPEAPTETPPPDITPAPELPAAEPEQPITDPKEDLVSTELSGLRSRLGLDDTADLDAITAAVDELKTKADTPTPDPEMVAASAAAVEKAETAVRAQDLMKEELARLSGELATIKASAASTVKASFFQGLKANGRLKPADEETWSARYDRDPEMVTDILSARAENSEVPVMASGVVGDAEPTGAADDEFDREYASLFSRPVSKEA